MTSLRKNFSGEYIMYVKTSFEKEKCFDGKIHVMPSVIN